MDQAGDVFKQDDRTFARLKLAESLARNEQTATSNTFCSQSPSYNNHTRNACQPVPPLIRIKAKALNPFRNPHRQHFADLKTHVDSGTFKTGGAYFHSAPEGDDPSKFDFAGSTLVVEAATKDEVLKILNTDIYTKSGVWDVEKAQILPVCFVFSLWSFLRSLKAVL